jgi:hypothetical protein
MHNAEDNDQRDDFTVEVTDLPPEEPRSIGSVLIDLGLRFLARVRSLDVNISWQARDEDEDEYSECFCDLHVSDLPPDEKASISGKLLDSGKRFWSLRRNVSTVALLGSVLLVLVLVSTNVASFHEKASSPIPSSLVPTPTRQIWDAQGRDASTKILISGNSTIVIEGVATGWTSRADGTVTWQARSAPQYCPPGPIVGNSRQVGRFPVWVLGFDGPRATIHLQRTKAISLTTWKGWEVPLQVEMKWNAIFPVMLTFGNISNGITPLFAEPSTGALLAVMIFNPQSTTQFTGQGPHKQRLHIWDINVYFPGAGCYILTADWYNGQWQIPFSAGA